MEANSTLQRSVLLQFAVLIWTGVSLFSGDFSIVSCLLFVFFIFLGGIYVSEAEGMVSVRIWAKTLKDKDIVQVWDF